MRDGLDLDNVVLLGRSLKEYSQYFFLSQLEPKEARILDMGSGVSSFCAEMAERGFQVIGADPIYDLPADMIGSKCQADLDEVCTQLPEVAHNYNWVFYKDIDDLRVHREMAYRRFLQDYRTNPHRYINASLPNTSFNDNEFTHSYVSYLLFMYDDRLSYEFHRESLRELARITENEVRIYPLMTLKARRSSFVDRLMADSELARLEFHIERTDFEFFRGSNETLIVKKIP